MLTTMADPRLFLRFGVALFIGVLIGLEREYAGGERHKEFSAGIRTFGLLGLLGCAGAMLAELMHSPWPLVALILVAGTLVSIIHFIDESQGRTGYTTKISALLTVATGAMVMASRVVQLQRCRREKLRRPMAEA